MRKIILLGVFFFIIACNTIKNKTDDIVKKENEKLKWMKPLLILKNWKKKSKVPKIQKTNLTKLEDRYF